MLDITNNLENKSKNTPQKQMKKKLTNNNRSKFWPLICTSLGLTYKNIEEEKTHSLLAYYDERKK